MGILLAFLIYQLRVLVLTPTVGMVLLTVLDGVIIVLVDKEYREISPRRRKMRRRDREV